MRHDHRARALIDVMYARPILARVHRARHARVVVVVVVGGVVVVVVVVSPVVGVAMRETSSTDAMPTDAAARTTSETRALFGGAVALALARRFRDASARAPVPNHQEVFVDDASEESVHVELVERERERGVGFYLDDWIEACEGEKIGRGRTEGGTCRGAMRARRDGVARVVDVFGCVIDLERVSARALIWHCRPRLGEESDDATMTGTADDADDADARAASDVIESCASSFKVLDWGLFDA